MIGRKKALGEVGFAEIDAVDTAEMHTHER